jgi:O-antigen/teichoic acid export membrane protein
MTGQAEIRFRSISTDEPDLGAKVIKGATWNVLGTVIKQTITIAATIVVARLLSPADYAIGGLAVSILNLFVSLTGQGFAQALIQRKDASDLTCHSVFWPMVIAGMMFTGLMIILAPCIARFYHQPKLIFVICFLSIGLAAGMVGSVPNALLQRAMRFRDINVIGVASGLISASLGIGAAILGFGYWALILPLFGSVVAVAVGAFSLSGYRPKLVFSWDEFKTTVSFGLSILGSNLLLYVNDYGDRLILGRLWRPEVFGHYHFALDRSRQPFSLILAQLNSVIFPAFSTIQHDPVQLRRALILGTHRFCLIVFPLYVLMLGLADPALPWLFGDQWRAAIPVFQVFAAFSFARAFAALVPGTYLAIGQPQAHLVFNAFRAGLLIPTLLYLSFLRADILTVSLTLCVIWLIQLPFFIGYLFCQINIRLLDFWGTFKRMFLATLAMYLTLLTSRAVLLSLFLSPWAVIAVGSIVSIAIFLSLMWGDLLSTVLRIKKALRGQEGECLTEAGSQRA